VLVSAHGCRAGEHPDSNSGPGGGLMMLLLPELVIVRGAVGVVVAGGGWCPMASDGVQQRPFIRNYLRLCWSAACVHYFHTGELNEQRPTTLKSTFTQLKSAERRLPLCLLP